MYIFKAAVIQLILYKYMCFILFFKVTETVYLYVTCNKNSTNFVFLVTETAWSH